MKKIPIIKKEKVYVDSGTNTCVACGREIPEGMLVCSECEMGSAQKRCAICSSLIVGSESVCSNCRAAILRSKNKD